MKKLIIAACAAACAAAVHAASVNWGGAIASPDDINTPLSAGQTALLLFSETAFSDDATSLSGTAIGANANNGGTIVGSYTLTSENVADFVFSAEWNRAGSDVNGYYAILIVNEDGTKASYMYMGEISGTTAMSATSSLDYNGMWGDANKQLTQNGYTVNVPEPTSGILLILGMAGLALKRKRA